MSDALNSDMPKKLKSRTPSTLANLYEWTGFLMEIDAIEKHFVSSLDRVHKFLQFTAPSFSLGVSQEQNQAMPKRVNLIGSETDILTTEVQVPSYDVEDVLIRVIMSSPQYSSTPLLLGTSSCSLIAQFLLLLERSKWHYGFAYFFIIIIKLVISNRKIGDDLIITSFA